VGWESKSEDAPNKEVHAEDLAEKLSKLTGKLEQNATPEASPTAEKREYTADELAKLKTAAGSSTARQIMAGMNDDAQTPSSPMKVRSRSSTLIYDPKAHGDSPGLPAVMVEAEEDSDVELDSGKVGLKHTARPPVELMEE
jgi:hypothetical protein